MNGLMVARLGLAASMIAGISAGLALLTPFGHMKPGAAALRLLFIPALLETAGANPDSLATLGLFNPSRRSEGPVAAQSAVQAAEPLPQLTGLVHGQLGGLALFKSVDGKQQIVRQGQDIAGWRLIEVRDKAVTLMQAGQTMRIFLKADRPGAQGLAPVPATASTGSAASLAQTSSQTAANPVSQSNSSSQTAPVTNPVAAPTIAADKAQARPIRHRDERDQSIPQESEQP